MIVLVFPATATLVQVSKNNSPASFSNPPIFVSARIPNVTYVGEERGGDQDGTNLIGKFLNNEKVSVSITVTCILGTYPGKTLTLTSNKTTIAPGMTQWFYFNFVGTPYEISYSVKYTYVADPISGSAPTSASGGGSRTVSPSRTSSSSGGGGSSGGGSSTTGDSSTSQDNGTSDYGSFALPILIIVIVVLGCIGGFFVFKKGGGPNEQRIRQLTSYEYQDWVMEKLGARAATVFDTRKGIDGFTNDNTPIVIKQSDGVGKAQVENFMKALTQIRSRSGIMVAFRFDIDAQEAIDRARMNRMDIRLMTVRELINRPNIQAL